MKNSYTVFGRGFVGTNVVKFLRKKKYKVFLPKKGKFKFNKNLHNIIYCIGGVNFINDPEGEFDANLGIVPKIIFNNKFTSFTYISSTRVYFSNPQNKTKENDQIYINSNIKNFFHNSLKLTAESLCLSLRNKNIKVVRVANLFGNNFTNQILLLPTLIRSSLKGKKINIFVNKKSSKDYIHIDEVSDVLIKIINKGKHRLYNIASGNNIEISKIIERIQEITNCRINYTNQKTTINEPIINIDRIKKEFNYKPKKDLIKSLDQLINNYKNYA